MSKRQPAKSYTADVIIVGAGPAGLCLAILLGTAGLSVQILEHSPLAPSIKKESDGRTVALLRPSVGVLYRAGVDAENLEDTAPLETLRLIDMPPGSRAPLRIDFEANEIAEAYFGLNIRNDQLRDALLEQARACASITLTDQAEIDDITITQSAAVIKAGTSTYSAPLLIGADGKNSVVREKSSIANHISDYDQDAITCIIAHDDEHNNTSIEFHRPGGPFTLVPLAGNRSSVVWLESRAQAQEIIKLDRADFTARLQAESHNELGHIHVITQPRAWPIILQQAASLTAPRTALVAEAAHALPPSGAQGLNLSLRDVETLADLVIDHARVGLDIGCDTLLAKYARLRKHDITPRTYAVDGLNRLILSENNAVRLLRRQGLAIAAALPPVRHALMRFGWASA